MYRCVNIDWLEVFVLESPSLFPCNADFFRCQGWRVEQREFGTRVFAEMFTLFDLHDEPFLEVRRCPKSSYDNSGILSPESCHIRLTNRYCYFHNCVQLLRNFLSRYSYEFRRIYRIDICLDFERFDLGDDPQRFVSRYLRHKFAKINQANRNIHGEDRWDGCVDNSLSWGSKKSMVSTKLYNKSLELKQERMKPYIIQSWFACNLITNPITMQKRRSDGSLYVPTIWRVEFSVKSGAIGWAIIEDNNGGKRKLRTIENRLSTYDTKEKQLYMFASLAHHYFHFKYYEPNKRKDRCKDKVLFVFDSVKDSFAKLDLIATSSKPSQDDERLRQSLEKYRLYHLSPDINKAIEVIIENINRDKLRTLAEDPWDIRQVEELQALLRRRIALPEEDFNIALQRVRELLYAAAHPFG